MSTVALAGGPSIGVEPSGSDAAAWLREFFGPALAPADGPPEWMLRINQSDAALGRTRGQIPADAELLPCFASDRHLLELRTHRTASATLVDDSRRRCAMRLSPPTLEIVVEEGTSRWRIVPAFVVNELTAARLRHSDLEMHAAGVEVDGAGVAIIGPKRAGKTTLSMGLLLSGLCRYVCNDQAFARVGPDGPVLWGVPTGVTMPLILTHLLPQLELDGQWVDRPYLYTLDELANGSGSPRPEDVELWLGPHQLASRLGVERAGSAPLKALLFPRFAADAVSWSVGPISRADVPGLLMSNVYGDAVRPREATIFEALEGGVADPPVGVAHELAATVPAFSLEFGPRAWSSDGFAADVLEAMGLR